MNLRTDYENSSIDDINVVMLRVICFMYIMTLMMVIVKMITTRDGHKSNQAWVQTGFLRIT